MKGLSDLNPANPPELRRYEHIDPDMLLNVTEVCSRSRCSLQDGHEGPHAEISPFDGMVYDVWGTDGAQVSEPALEVAMAINRARDEAIEALEKAHFIRLTFQRQYRDVTKEADPILRMLLDDFNYWPDGSYNLEDSGFEASGEELRDELMRVFEGDDS